MQNTLFLELKVLQRKRSLTSTYASFCNKCSKMHRKLNVCMRNILMALFSLKLVSCTSSLLLMQLVIWNKYLVLWMILETSLFRIPWQYISCIHVRNIWPLVKSVVQGLCSCTYICFDTVSVLFNKDHTNNFIAFSNSLILEHSIDTYKHRAYG